MLLPLLRIKASDWFARLFSLISMSYTEVLYCKLHLEETPFPLLVLYSVSRLADENVFVVQLLESWSYLPLGNKTGAGRRVQEALATIGWRLKY